MQAFIRRSSALWLLFLLPLAMAESSLAVQPVRVDARLNTHVDSLGPATPQSIINAFIAAERSVREALNQYTFKRDVVLQTIGGNGEVTGEYIRNSQFLFDDKGNRIERVLYLPPSTLRRMRITKEDIQDLGGAQLLGIDITETEKYRLEYVGLERSARAIVF